MEVTLLPIVTLVKPPHIENAWSPMEVTLSGIVTLVRPLHPLNACSPMEVTGRLSIVDGIVKEPVVDSMPMPVMVMVFPVVEYDSSAFRDAGRMSSNSSRIHPLDLWK